jgi:predicted lipoprotein with Yx(FWY)xxD motif
VKRIVLSLLVAVAVLAVPAAAIAKARVTVRLANTGVGKLLVDGESGGNSGFTLYMFTKDSRNRDNCMKKSGCISIWPPLTVTGRPSAGPGVKGSLLGTIAIGHGKRQVTYSGHPLYLYAEDSSPASTFYVGINQFGGFWYGLNAAAKEVK